MTLEAGTRVGKYEIQSLIGEGGMGRVYRALDTELGRPVALKFLPEEITADPKRMRRFEQEARAVSALNHPNIITVHDIGQTADGRRFFATELVEGATLREHTQARGLKLAEVLDIVAQVAGALVEAHGRGIVHRDVKPENVMVRRDRIVKVLDFGLAKLTGNPAGGVDTEAATRALVATDAGAVMGTVSYMSPEQSRGEEVDARTDVWSLGVVLYEMLAGHLPFRGKSANHTLVAIQDEEPPPLSAHLPEVPDLLQEVVSDALAKDRDARLTARQMLAKLQRLKRRLDSGAHLDHSVAPNISSASGELSGRTTSSPPPGATASGAHPTLAAAAETQTTSAGVRAKALGGRRAWLAVALGGVALVGVGFAAYRFVWRSQTAQPDARAAMKIKTLTDTGKASEAVISPDGRLVAYVFSEGARQSIHIRQVVEPSDKEIVPPAPDQFYRGLAFSPDGNYLHYISGAGGALVKDLYRVPLLGGATRRLNHDVDSALTFSPDGRQFAFMRRDGKTKETAIIISEVSGEGERQLALRRPPEEYRRLAWSPDGQTIAYMLYGEDKDGYYTHVGEARVSDGQETVISAARWRFIGGLAWLPDRSALIVAARDRASPPGTPAQIWQLAYPGGEARQLTNDSNQFDSLSLTGDGKALVATRSEVRSNVWVAPAGDYTRARQITNGRENGDGGCAWTPDGRIVYTSWASGYGDIWVMNADGSTPRQLTFGTAVNSFPFVSPDGRYIVFETNRGVGWGVWRMNADGGGLKELVRNAGQFSFPQVSPDGQWVFYAALDPSGKRLMWRVPIDGGAPEQLTQKDASLATLSPDGKLMFYYYRENPDASSKIEIVPATGGAPVQVIDSPKDTHDAGWSPDGRALVVVKDTDNVSNLWTLPLDGGKPRQLTDWKTDKIFGFVWSRDGRQLAVARGDTFSDVVLISDFK
jgi:serine/threonine protein kinase/Tol biopolymer transport system component